MAGHSLWRRQMSPTALVLQPASMSSRAAFGVELTAGFKAAYPTAASTICSGVKGFLCVFVAIFTGGFLSPHRDKSFPSYPQARGASTASQKAALARQLMSKMPLAGLIAGQQANQGQGH